MAFLRPIAGGVRRWTGLVPSVLDQKFEKSERPFSSSKAGIHASTVNPPDRWVPAFARPVEMLRTSESGILEKVAFAIDERSLGNQAALPAARSTFGRAALTRRGRRTTNSVKLPSSLSTEIVQPCCWVTMS